MKIDFSSPRVRWLIVTIAIIGIYSLTPYPRIHHLEINSSFSIGCGVGTVILTTPSGVQKIRTGLDAIHAFGGNKIQMSELVYLLQLRQRSISRGFGPMRSNAVLCYIICDLLGDSGEPSAIPVLSGSLSDPDPIVSGWACIALYRIGDKNPDLRNEISKISFPKSASGSASSRGVSQPGWLKKTEPNQSPEPMHMAVTPPAAQASRQP